MKNKRFNISIFALLAILGAFLFISLAPLPAYAVSLPGTDISDVSEDIVASTEKLPGLISGFSYLAGVLLCVLGIFKTLDHVSNSQQTPIRTPIIRFLIGGALFSLPAITSAALNAISGGAALSGFDDHALNADVGAAASWLGLAASFLSLDYDMNVIYFTVMNALGKVPGLISAVGYLLALLTIVSALFKTRDHVDDPTRVPLKDVVIRYLIGGALLGLPVIYDAMYSSIGASNIGVGLSMVTLVSSAFGAGAYSVFTGGFAGTCITGSSIMDTISDFASLFGGGGGGGSTGTIGDMICAIANSNAVLPFFLTTISYLIGLVFGIWGLLKIRDHVTNPQQTPLWDGISRLLAGGAFFAMPFVAYAISESITYGGFATGYLAVGVTSYAGTSSLDTVCDGSVDYALDTMMSCLMYDVLGPIHYALQFFCYAAGMIFIMIGISRVIKSSQEGAKGPGGLGTISTFVTGAMLMSITTLIGVLSQSFFSDGDITTQAELAYTSAMSAAELEATYNVISAVLKFMIIIGMLSFVRGMFIMRDVAEGKQQASVMSGITHIIGGALAINLGPLLNSVQNTLGISSYGITFS